MYPIMDVTTADTGPVDLKEDIVRIFDFGYRSIFENDGIGARKDERIVLSVVNESEMGRCRYANLCFCLRCHDVDVVRGIFEQNCLQAVTYFVFWGMKSF